MFVVLGSDDQIELAKQLIKEKTDPEGPPAQSAVSVLPSTSQESDLLITV